MTKSDFEHVRWSPEELEVRTREVARFWARRTDRRVKVEDARRVARLSLDHDTLLKVLLRASRPPLGAAWSALRSAERELLDLEAAAAAAAAKADQ